MADAAKPRDANVTPSGLDPLRAVIREQQVALDGLESNSRELESVIEHLLSSRNNQGNNPETVAAPTRNGLSKRELQVLALMVDGKTSKEIATALGISFKTAVTHRASIMCKLDVHETASVVREAIRRGLV
ncbi:MAG: LuxR C-terminal-related transcriptional regulator [Acidobacteriia bacterium]|nr:LuxR C-terminal-related transcriptional regulator [Terriglobia bacterium]